MAMLKFGNAMVATPLVDPGKWVDKKVKKPRVKIAKNVIAKFDPSQWLLSHVTIMASVDVDFADPSDKKSNYLIKPEYSIFVNNNGDAWERNLLTSCARSFLGADNFVEHVQIPELSKGKVIDVALREIPFTKDSEGNDLTTVYVDILIATSRKHKDLIEKITSGEYSATSMGCLIKFSQCTKCGKVFEDESGACKHARFFKNNFFYDPNGVKRIIAELCGNVSDPDSCRFVDASWVRKPAFEGAVLRNLIQPKEDVSEKIQTAILMPSFQRQPEMYLKAASQAAADILNEIEAQEDTPEPPKDDIGFPDAPEDTDTPLTVDKPTEENETPADVPGETPEEAPQETPPAEEAPAAPAAAPQSDPAAEPQIVEPKEDATVKEVKDLVKKQVLNQIRKELLKEQATEQQKQNDRPVQLETDTNESLVKDASLQRVLTAAKRCGNEKLLNGFYILSNLKDWGKFRKYGYTRNDLLAMLYYVDKYSSEKTVGEDAIRALSRIKLSSDGAQSFFTNMIVEIGRKPSAFESRKLLKWAKILRNMEGF